MFVFLRICTLFSFLLKLINNSSSLNNGNHDRKGVFGYVILISIDFYDFNSPFSSLVLLLIEKIYQTLKTVVDYIFTYLEVRKNTPLRVVFSTLFSVFGNVIKHCLSCLIHYVRPPRPPLRYAKTAALLFVLELLSERYIKGNHQKCQGL